MLNIQPSPNQSLVFFPIVGLDSLGVGDIAPNYYEGLRRPLDIADQTPVQAPDLGQADTIVSPLPRPQELEEAITPLELTLDQGSKSLTGLVTGVKEFQDWAVATLWTSERESHKLTGSIVAALVDGLEYAVTGDLSNHPRHGESFEVKTAQPHISDDDAAVVRYLKLSFENIGEARARKYVEKLRKDAGQEGISKLRDQLLTSPWEVDLSSISAKAKFSDGQDDESAAAQYMVLRALQLRLGSVPGFREATWKGLASILAARTMTKIAAQSPVDELEDEPKQVVIPPDFVNQALALLLANPYALIGKAPYYGFSQAEQIGRRAGVPLNAPFRMAALVEYAVDAQCQTRGHTYLSTRDFAEAVRRADPSLSAQEALVAALKSKSVVLEEGRLYSATLYAAEIKAAKLIAGMMQHSDPITKRSPEDIRAKLIKDAAKIDPSFAKGFAPEQIEGIVSVMTSPTRLHVISGGPGTGKTSFVQALVYLCKNRKFSFGAPTGKAAKVLTARVQPFGYVASTFHSLLRGDGDSFEVDEKDPLDAQIIVADETTMDGLQLGAAIMAAMQSDAHIIFLGDPGIESILPGKRVAGQLPSISPGRFMADLLKVPGINHCNLVETFRNSGGILDVINEVAIGQLKTHDRENVKFSHSLPPAEEGFAAVMQDYLRFLAKDGLDKTLLIMPKRVGEKDVPGWNTTYANQVLRENLNPHGEKIAGSTLRLGDRVIIRENMRVEQPDEIALGAVKGRLNRQSFSRLIDWEALKEKGKKLNPLEEADSTPTERLVNGDTGTIVSYSVYPQGDRRSGSKWIRIALDDGREVEFPGDCASSLDLAYALTVHSAQGSEYASVMSIVTDGTAHFMNSNMLKTAFSRAKGFLSIYGDDAVLRRIAATASPVRNSTLLDRVTQEMGMTEDEEMREESTTPVAA